MTLETFLKENSSIMPKVIESNAEYFSTKTKIIRMTDIELKEYEESLRNELNELEDDKYKLEEENGDSCPHCGQDIDRSDDIFYINKEIKSLENKISIITELKPLWRNLA